LPKQELLWSKHNKCCKIVRDYVLIAHLYLYVNISGELEVGLLLQLIQLIQLLHFTFCLTKIKLTIISSPIIFISHGRTSGIVQ
jgi:hypothetical protein